MRFRSEISDFRRERFQKRRCLLVTISGGAFEILEQKIRDWNRNGIGQQPPNILGTLKSVNISAIITKYARNASTI